MTVAEATEVVRVNGDIGRSPRFEAPAARDTTWFVVASFWLTIVGAPLVNRLVLGARAWQADSEGISDSALGQAVGLIGVAGALLWLTGRILERAREGSLVSGVSWFPFAACVPVLLSAAASGANVRGAVEIVVFALALAFVRLDRHYLRLLLNASVATALISLALGAVGLGFAYGWEHGGAKAVIGEYALAGVFGHPNTLGIAMAFALPMCASARSRRARLSAFLVLFLALLLSASRTSWIAAAVGCLVMILGRGGLSRRWAARLLGLLLVASAMLPFIPWGDSEFTYRGLIWRLARGRLAGNFVTGIGNVNFEAYEAGFRIFNVNHGHNWMLSALLFGGIGAAGAFTWLLVRIIRVVRQGASDAAWILAGYLAAVLVAGALENVLPFRYAGYGVVLQGVLFAGACVVRPKAVHQQGNLGATPLRLRHRQMEYT